MSKSVPDRSELVRRLRAGCPLVPEADSPDEDCFDYKASNALMLEAVTALEAAEQDAERYKDALITIGGGWTARFPGAPDPMTTESPLQFHSDMWSWSQKVAKAAIAGEKE